LSRFVVAMESTESGRTEKSRADEDTGGDDLLNSSGVVAYDSQTAKAGVFPNISGWYHLG
jgi:hypothetical protein